MNKSLLSSKSDEWATPKTFFDRLNDEFGFTLDPCSTHENAKCPKHYTSEDNGLLKNWGGETVFMNPPYSRGKQSAFIEKAYQESLNGATVVCLIPARTDTKIWHEFIFPYATEIRYVKGRIKFSNAKSGAPFPSAVVIFKPKKG